jgi:riboflavin kinase/FMN adenylyltransferase
MKRSVVALGTFDGVHLGHQRILKDTVSYARRKKLKSIAITFDPHPQQLIIPERGLKLLTTLAERKELLKKMGIEQVKVFKFNKAMQKLSYKDFVVKCLVAKLKAAVIFVGFDFAFGHARLGDVRGLRKLSRKCGFTVKVVRPVKINHSAIKSSLIRDLVSHGNFNRAIHFLGHPYSLTGKVIRGTGRGKQLEIPTANLKVDKHKLIPQHGVYVGKVNRKKCVVNIGARPTFGAGGTAVEVHILGFFRNLYGKNLKVDLYRKIRDEIQFSDVKELKEQIAKDIAICRRSMI